MTLLACWVLFPLALAVLALGCGLLLEAASAVRLPTSLLPAAGLAVMVVAVSFTTMADATAELSIPVVIALAVAGFLLSPPWKGRDLDRWAVASALAVFASFAAPVVISGAAGFAGYIKLDDTATWLAITDHVMQHGRNLHGLAPSSYEATLAFNLPSGYPIGAFLPLGVGRALVGQDAAWVFQPYLAFLAAMLALAFYTLVTPLVRSPWLRALAVFIASQAALLFAYSLWGGAKELAAAWLLALLAALAAQALRESGLPRSLLPLAVASAAMLSVLSFGGAIWLAPLLLPMLVLFIYLRDWVAAARAAAAFSVFAAALAIPSLVTAKTFLRPAAGTLTSGSDLGNLIEPLSSLQLFGIWPVSDFRFRPDNMDATYLLIVALVAAAAVGLWWAWSRRGWELMLYVVTTTVGCLLVMSLGSPWVDAKALATASPAVVLAGLVGATVVFERGRQIEASVLIAAIAGGVLWSNALAYSNVNLAPHDRFSELERIGDQIAGQGPTLMTDYEPYGDRHFLRQADPEGASELRRRVVPLTNGRPLDKLEFADIDDFRPDGLLVYRTLVLRRSPVASRPPSAYRLVSQRRYYEVWQRPEPVATRILERLPLGGRFDPAGKPRCADVSRLARIAGRNGRLAYVRRPHPVVIDLTGTAHPPNWVAAPEQPGGISPLGSGAVDVMVTAPNAGRYGIWIQGSFRRELDLSVDGRRVTSERNELSHGSQFVPLGSVELTAATHEVRLSYGGEDLRPGSDGPPMPLGPLVLSTATADRPVEYLPSTNAGSLCGQRLDWIEALGP
jgi:hypothetical protein